MIAGISEASKGSMNKSSLIVSGPERFEATYESLKKNLAQYDIPVEINFHEPTPQASILWAALPLVALYLGKPFVEAILKKAGEEAYPVLKNSVQNFVLKMLPSEKRESPRVSLALSIYVELEGGGRIKALLWEGIDGATQVEALSKLFELIEKDALKKSNPEESEHWQQMSRWGTIFIRFDIDRRQWVPVDIIAEAQGKKIPADYETTI